MDLDVAADLGDTTCFACAVANHLREVGCPFLAEALIENTKGTLVTMADCGALVVKEIDRGLANVEHQGEDNQKTWDDYFSKLRQALEEEIVDFEAGGQCLAFAMDKLAIHIHTQHWKAFGKYITKDGKPEWVGLWPEPRGPGDPPCPSGTQESQISIRLNETYSWDGSMFVYVVMGGKMMVKDERPSQKCYVAKVWGNPQIKYLTVNPKHLPALENLAATDKQGFLTEMAEAAEDYGESKPLTLADLRKRRT
jgi:hypothetical protein